VVDTKASAHGKPQMTAGTPLLSSLEPDFALESSPLLESWAADLVADEHGAMAWLVVAAAICGKNLLSSAEDNDSAAPTGHPIVALGHDGSSSLSDCANSQAQEGQSLRSPINEFGQGHDAEPALPSVDGPVSLAQEEAQVINTLSYSATDLCRRLHRRSDAAGAASDQVTTARPCLACQGREPGATP
jgi:hypothetical protein